MGKLAATFLNAGFYEAVTAKNFPSEQILSHTEDFFLAHKIVAAEPGAYCITWEDFAPF